MFSAAMVETGLLWFNETELRPFEHVQQLVHDGMCMLIYAALAWMLYNLHCLAVKGTCIVWHLGHLRHK